ncbi:putative cathepsin L-like cysteine protease [Gregarina niphandrodes]|uniref:Cathepsin L-like cysteine protease n=1 Tax=Gregarina niphandrodes TaxID=110365 RepID=A0A023B4P9_GRENI|nr:putative cathepsin L-like cysteine protease [Gregarina niphandrodes]EZG57133.1 putative cathepsin L-like cysteine protease [Gregarina niphandrodes]|eukprot:XP_011131092.1 putative cathepsin L-like cysteine protease [Gregarina niphandrodes]
MSGPVMLPARQFWISPPESTHWSFDVSQLNEPQWNEIFRDFHARFDKGLEYTIASPEYSKRREIFKRNAHMIYQHNLQQRTHGSNDVSLAPNQFMDMDWPEFRSRHLQAVAPDNMWYGSFPTDKRIDGSAVLSGVANRTLPDSFNWIDHQCVTPVKNQQHCGSCWAFSSTGSLEGAYCAQTGRLVSLSEQQLVDCARKEGTMGCSGGFMDNAYQYVIDNGGICTEEAYPYEGVDTHACRASNCTASMVKVRGMMDLPAHDEKAMRAALVLYGPVAVAIEADRPVFQFYHTGVMKLKCGKHLNHAVLAVGYGTDAKTGEHYWLVKNSWGDRWGDLGYIKLTRDHHRFSGECGILLAPVVPLIDS